MLWSMNDGDCWLSTAFSSPDMLFLNGLKNEERNKLQIQEPWTKMWIITVLKCGNHSLQTKEILLDFGIGMQNFVLVNLSI